MIYAAADLHGNLVDPPPDASALLLGGDICPDFLHISFRNRALAPHDGAAGQGDWLDTQFRAWLERLSLPVIAIWGNHDFVGEHPQFVPELPWTLLQDSDDTLVYDHAAYRIWGTSWVPGLPRWAFYASDMALAARAELVPHNLDILLSHGPPYFAGDFIPTGEKQRIKYGNYSGDHVGDHHLTLAVREKRPRVTVCGHIHEAHGKHWLHGNRVLNVASVTESYKLRDDFWTRIVL